MQLNLAVCPRAQRSGDGEEVENHLAPVWKYPSRLSRHLSRASASMSPYIRPSMQTEARKACQTRCALSPRGSSTFCPAHPAPIASRPVAPAAGGKAPVPALLALAPALPPGQRAPAALPQARRRWAPWLRGKRIDTARCPRAHTAHSQVVCGAASPQPFRRLRIFFLSLSFASSSLGALHLVQLRVLLHGRFTWTVLDVLHGRFFMYFSDQ